jgi:GH15 family glucan-1,4-alpha-glucosidase
MREAERQKEEAIQYARRVTAEKNELGKTATSLDKNYTQEMEGRIASSIAAAQSKLAIAREQGDAKAEVEALTSISQLGYEQGKLAEIKSRHAMEEKEAKAKPVLPTQPVQQTPPPDPRAEEWASRNEWFGKDSAMTYTAFDLHRKITEEEGLDPQSNEYYAEIDKRIRLEFPHKFGKVENQTSKPTQNVASATRSSKAGRKSVRLTSSQVAIAKKLGVPLEEYAKQLITKEV